MHQLMGELRSWKQQNERRLQQLSQRAKQPLGYTSTELPGGPPPQHLPPPPPQQHEWSEGRREDPTPMTVAGFMSRPGVLAAKQNLGSTPQGTPQTATAADIIRGGLAEYHYAQGASHTTPQSTPQPVSRRDARPMASPAVGHSASRRGDPPNLRELQRELISLKSSLSVYLGT